MPKVVEEVRAGVLMRILSVWRGNLRKLLLSVGLVTLSL